MAATVYAIETIVSDPDLRGGRPIISGTSIRVQDLVAGHLYKDMTPGDLARNYTLTISQVYAALAWYYDHQDLIDGQMKADRERVPELLAALDKRGLLLHLD